MAARLHVLGFVALLAACSTPESAPSPPKLAGPSRPLTFLTGPSTGAYSPLGHALAEVYNTKVAGIHVTATSTDGPEGAGANAKALEAGQVDLAFSRADIAYQVFRQ